MEKQLNLILPGNPRYQPKNLKNYFGYDHLYQMLARVEIATLKTLAEIGIIPQEEFASLSPRLELELISISTSEVDKIEREITKHDVRAWIKKAQELINNRLSRWVHVPLTSYDALDTGRILQFYCAYQDAVAPALKKTIRLIAEMVEKNASQIQIGRTHGQHALPITVGFWLATILNRLIYNAKNCDAYAENLAGKISGAVGAYNAQIGLGFDRLCGEKTFEQRVLEKLDLKPSPISTQVLPPEPLAYFLFSASLVSATLAQFGRDCRHLMRTEIAEIAEQFETGQVGSSTMAHKRNPINFENLEGMWIRTKNEFGKVLDTLISDHQRDLVGSSVARDFPIILINLQHQLDALLRKNSAGTTFLERLEINKKTCLKNLSTSRHLILAEPLYIAIQMAGYMGDAHELVNKKLVPIAQERSCLLIEAFLDLTREDDTFREVLKNIPEKIISLLHQPEKYTGRASEKAKEIAAAALDYAT